MNTAAAASALYSLQAMAAANNLAVNLEWLGLDASALAGMGVQAPLPQHTPAVANLPFAAHSSYLQAAASSAPAAPAAPHFGAAGGAGLSHLGSGSGVHKPLAYRHLTSGRPPVDSPGEGGLSRAGSAGECGYTRVGTAGVSTNVAGGTGPGRLPAPHLSASSQKSYGASGGGADKLTTLQVQPLRFGSIRRIARH